MGRTSKEFLIPAALVIKVRKIYDKRIKMAGKSSLVKVSEMLTFAGTAMQTAAILESLQVRHPGVFAALNVRALLADELHGFALMLQDHAALTMDEDSFRLLNEQVCSLEEQLAQDMVQDRAAAVAELQRLGAVMDMSPWTLHPDYGCVRKDAVLDLDRNAAAKQAFERYDFGGEVSEMGGWEYCSNDSVRTCTVYLETEREDDGPAPRWRLTFTVQFDPSTDQITDVYAIDDRGSIWGHLPNPAPVPAIPT